FRDVEVGRLRGRRGQPLQGRGNAFEEGGIRVESHGDPVVRRFGVPAWQARVGSGRSIVEPIRLVTGQACRGRGITCQAETDHYSRAAVRRTGPQVIVPRGRIVVT